MMAAGKAAEQMREKLPQLAAKILEEDITKNWSLTANVYFL